MGLFSRRHTSASSTDEVPAADESVDESSSVPETGPWDSANAPHIPEGRIDLGSLQVPAVHGMQLRLEAPYPGAQPGVLVLALGGSTLELRAFAAPRSEGIWDELRQDILAELTHSKASHRLVKGAHGTEVFAKIPVKNDAGAAGSVAVRFIGVDGPRWFLRGVLQGPAANSEAESQPLRHVFDNVVVVRDGQARPPRELLPLHIPDAPESTAATAKNAPELLPLEPGPSIAELR